MCSKAIISRMSMRRARLDAIGLSDYLRPGNCAQGFCPSSCLGEVRDSSGSRCRFPDCTMRHRLEGARAVPMTLPLASTHS
jgi:hypothetical protein